MLSGPELNPSKLASELTGRLSLAERATPAVDEYCQRLAGHLSKISGFIPRSKELQAYIEAMLKVNSPDAQSYHDTLWEL